ncbi:MAG: 30S ribosomal protein S8 [Acidobacteria bacterium]|nr:MAG: 30S ribosomal protein S8 [Acidobacteriota bacterium]
MSMTDPIADMLTRIRNAIMAGHKSTDMPASNIKEALARILEAEGYISGCERIKDRKQGILRVRLRYGPGGEPVITGLKRISRPGCRVYVSATEIPRVLGGLGINVLSTSKGLLSGSKARKQGVGGELLVSVW